MNGGQIPFSALVLPKLVLQLLILFMLTKDTFLTFWTHLVTSNEKFHISVLIGADLYWEFIQNHIASGNSPTSVQSQQGTHFQGHFPCLSQFRPPVFMFQPFLVSQKKQNTMIPFGKLSLWLPHHQHKIQMQEYMATKIIVQPDGAYSLKFPWKGAHPFLPTNCTVYVLTESDLWLSPLLPLIYMYNCSCKQLSDSPSLQGFHFSMTFVESYFALSNTMWHSHLILKRHSCKYI